MKKICQLLIIIMFPGFFSCSDDEGAGDMNHARFYGESYPLEQGAIYQDNNHTVIAIEEYVFEDRYLHDGAERTDQVKGFTAEVKERQTGNFLVSLYGNGFVVSDLTKDARGNGACVCLRVASPETDKLAEGKYIFSPNRTEFTFKGYSSVNYNSAENTIPNELTGGEVNISREGDIYTIRFQCKTSFGSPVEGVYTGPLKSFDIRKEAGTLNFYEEVKLEALFDKVVYTDTEEVEHREPDYSRATSFFLSSTQQVYTANLYKNLAAPVKKGIDIALAYDREKESVYFESPVKMRALLWHNTYEDELLLNYSFDLPCHTKYMFAPRDFTNEDFESLTRQEDFAFAFAGEEVVIPVTMATPLFVFVQTGNGLQGVMRVREIAPEGSEMIEGIAYPVNPHVIMDVKFPRSFSEQKIR